VHLTNDIVPLIAVTIRSNDRKVSVNIDTVKTVAEFKVCQAG